MSHQLVSFDWADRLVHAHDASVYRYVPRAVARPKSLQDVQDLLALARTERTGLTFRTGGTSLSGQAVTPGVLVLLGRGWDSFRVEKNGEILTCGPALRGGVANAALQKFSRRIGPDPASIQAACIGGIVANNASGMCCGTEENSYQTIEGLTLLLASGTELKTREVDCNQKFRALEPRLYSGLLHLREKLLSDSAALGRIKRKRAMKNTMGYSIQALIDFSEPVDILNHILVGSEGTLAFMADMTLRTVPLRPHRASALLAFDRLEDACAVAPELRDLGMSAIELLDSFSVESISNKPTLPSFLKRMNRDGACLLLQVQEEDHDALQAILHRAKVIEGWRQVSHRTDFFTDGQKQSELWELRKGIFPAVGARRPRGTSVLIEDVAFPLSHLAEGTRALRALLDKHQYQDAVIYGHARDGNLHFILSQNFDSVSEINRYRRFLDDMVECVALRFQGSLKAEHGTGRNMAPFVETEWGSDIYQLMREVKYLFDPENILNPGVLINSNQRVHIENLKETPRIDESLDGCIECGFCEPVCPSQGLTLSPRGRIVLEREKHLLKNSVALDNSKVKYLQFDSCAADGLCARACPVEINTGTWVKKQRAEHASGVNRALAHWSAENMSTTEVLAHSALKGAQVLAQTIGNKTLESTTRWFNKKIGLPVWSEHWIPRSTEVEHTTPSIPSDSLIRLIVVQSCLTRQSQTQRDALTLCAQRAGVEISRPTAQGLCCGQPWSSKGFQKESVVKLAEWITFCFEVSHEGRYPIVVDNSPCEQAMFEDAQLLPDELRKKLAMLQVWDPVDCALFLARRLTLDPLEEELKFFPVCSVSKSGRRSQFDELARMICKKPVLPLQESCCGMAGDRGMWFPELTKNATDSIVWGNGDARIGFCTSRTCEIALSSSQVAFSSIFEALEKSSRRSSASNHG